MVALFLSLIHISADIQYRTRVSFGQIEKELMADKRFLTINRGLIINMDYVRNIDAVSYTHLDVYKRQSHDR